MKKLALAIFLVVCLLVPVSVFAAGPTYQDSDFKRREAESRDVREQRDKNRSADEQTDKERAQAEKIRKMQRDIRYLEAERNR